MEPEDLAVIGHTGDLLVDIYARNLTHIYILPQCSTTAARVLNPAGMDAQFERLRCAISRGILIQWADLNVKERILMVNKQVTRMEGELDVTEPKTKNSVRKVALSQQAVDLLVQEHEQHPDNPILFPSPRTGGYWSPDAVSRINRKLLKNAGIEEHVRFHDLRHTFATMAISSGVDVKTLSSMLGHYSAGFTLDTYTHITNDMQRGAAEKIGGFMESATAITTPEPPDPPEESRCKVIPFEKVG